MSERDTPATASANSADVLVPSIKGRTACTHGSTSNAVTVCSKVDRNWTRLDDSDSTVTLSRSRTRCPPDRASLMKVL
jgi:hypothetical protein